LLLLAYVVQLLDKAYEFFRFRSNIISTVDPTAATAAAGCHAGYTTSHHFRPVTAANKMTPAKTPSTGAHDTHRAAAAAGTDGAFAGAGDPTADIGVV
jgi:hypothetical protein